MRGGDDASFNEGCGGNGGGVAHSLTEKRALGFRPSEVHCGIIKLGGCSLGS
jgi:hypothetical protein